MSRENPAWDALVRETKANPHFSSGRIASALKAIRSACVADGIPEEDWPKEIEARAAMYREMWPTMPLTPTSLASNWYRVLTVGEKKARLDALQATIDKYTKGGDVTPGD